MNKIGKRVISAAIASIFAISGIAFGTQNAFAHGGMRNDRAYLGSSRGGHLNTNVGGAQWEPQSAGEAMSNSLLIGFTVSEVSLQMHLA